MHNYKKKIIFRNILWLLMEQGSRVIMGLMISSILARQLGVEMYGLFQYSIGIVAIFSSISFICGAEVLVPMLVSSTKEDQRKIMGNAFIVRIFFSILAYILLLLFSFWVKNKQEFYLIAVLGITILFSESFAVITAWLQSENNNRPRSLLVMISLFIKCLILVIFFLIGINNIFLYAWIFIFDPIFIAFGLLFIYLKINKKLFFQFSITLSYRLFKLGLPFFMGLVAMFIFLRLDIIFLKEFSSLSILGNYIAAKQLAAQVISLSPILVISLAPTLIYKEKDINLIKKNILVICLIMLIFSLFIAFFTQYISYYIINFLFGKKYLLSISILKHLIWASCLLFLNEGLNIYLLKIGQGSLVTKKWLFVLVTTIPSYLYFVPKYSVKGAIIGYSIGYATACIFNIVILLSPNYQLSEQNLEGVKS